MAGASEQRRRPLPARAAARGRARRRHPHRRGAAAAVRGDDPGAGAADPDDARRRRGAEGARRGSSGRSSTGPGRSSESIDRTASAPEPEVTPRTSTPSSTGADDARCRRRHRAPGRRRPPGHAAADRPRAPARAAPARERARRAHGGDRRRRTPRPPPPATASSRELATLGRSAATDRRRGARPGPRPADLPDDRARRRRRREPAPGRAAAADAQLLVARRRTTRARSSTRSSYVYRMPPRRGAGRRVHVRHRRPTPRSRRSPRSAASALARGEPPPTREDLERAFRARWMPDRRSATRPPRRATSGASRPCSTTSGTARSAAVGEALARGARLRADPRARRRQRRPSSSTARSTGSTACRRAASRSSTTRPARPASQKGVDESLQLSIYALACRDALGLGTPERVTLYFTESALRLSHDPHGRAAGRRRGRTSWRGCRGCAPGSSRRRRRRRRAGGATIGRCARSGREGGSQNRAARHSSETARTGEDPELRDDNWPEYCQSASPQGGEETGERSARGPASISSSAMRPTCPMNVFRLRDELVRDYEDYTRSFLEVGDPRVKARVEAELDDGLLWPDPLIQLNPSFEPGGLSTSSSTRAAPRALPRHLPAQQRHDRWRPAAAAAPPPGRGDRRRARGENYVLTTGTGSGKSLAYIVPIVDHVLREPGPGIQAIVVYPMNALANSQARRAREVPRARAIRTATARSRFARYTGQENDEEREAILARPARHPAHQLRDARADPHPAATSGSSSTRRRACGSSSSTSCTPTAAGRAPTSRCSSAASARRCDADRAPVRRHVGHARRRGHAATSSSAEVARVATPALRRRRSTRSTSSARRCAARPPTVDLDDAGVRRRAARARRADGAAADDYDGVRRRPARRLDRDDLRARSRAGDGRLVARATPRPIGGTDGAAAELAELTGARPSDAARRRSSDTLLAGYALPSSPRPASRSSPSACTSSSAAATRSTRRSSPRPTGYLTLQRPAVRARATGDGCCCRSRSAASAARSTTRSACDEADATGRVVRAARARRPSGSDGQRQPGFLYLDADEPWPDDDRRGARAAPRGLARGAHGAAARVKSSRRARAAAAGAASTRTAAIGDRRRARPGSSRRRSASACAAASRTAAASRRDFGKLATLGSEGRSTATTILEPRGDPQPAGRRRRSTPEARKLL